MTLFLFLVACHVSARDDGEFMKAVLELAGCLSVEELDEDEVERYSDLHDNPLHLNYASRSKLLSSGLMSAYQVAVLMDHREMTGDILRRKLRISFTEFCEPGIHIPARPLFQSAACHPECHDAEIRDEKCRDRILAGRNVRSQVQDIGRGVR